MSAVATERVPWLESLYGCPVYIVRERDHVLVAMDIVSGKPVKEWRMVWKVYVAGIIGRDIMAQADDRDKAIQAAVAHGVRLKELKK